MYKQIYTFTESFSCGLMMFPPIAKNHLTKTPIPPDLRSPLLSCWPGLCKRLPRHTAYYCCPWLPSTGRRWIPISADTEMHFRIRAQSPVSCNWSPRPLPEHWLSWYQKVSCKLPKKVGSQQAVLPSQDACGPQGPTWHNNYSCRSSTHILVVKTAR